MNFKCDELCIHLKEGCETGREDGLCDKPDIYKEYGDVIDNLYEHQQQERYG